MSLIDELALFCTLAVQKGLVDREAVLSALHAWSASRMQSVRGVLLGDLNLCPENVDLLTEEVKRLVSDGERDGGTTMTAYPMQDSLFIELIEICDASDKVPTTTLDRQEILSGLGQTLSVFAAPNEIGPGDDFPMSSSSVQLDAKANRLRSSLPRLPGYDMVKVLGHGGMAVVYEARQLSLDRRVALKMILADEYVGEQEAARFRTESSAIARLRHVNIVQFYEVNEHEGLPYFSMELVEGGTLKQRLSAGALHPVPAARLLLKLAKAVHYAHRQGILHRDLKPQNILLNREQEPKIADFGLAKILGTGPGITRTGMVFGTPSYMAPEQAHGDIRAIGPATDVYALGTILYEILTGQPPYTGRSAVEILDRVKSGWPALPSELQPGVSRELEAMCLKSMERQPRDRYVSALELVNDLRRFLRGMSVRAPIVGSPVAERQESKMQRAKVPEQESRVLTIKADGDLLARAESLAHRLGVPLETLMVRGLKSMLFLLGEE